MRDTVFKPWGSETRIITTKEFDLWRLSIADGEETSLHHHANKDTLLMVMGGTIELHVDRSTTFLDRGEFKLIPKGVAHKSKAHGAAVILELEWPPNREDLVRLEDKYGRCG